MNKYAYAKMMGLMKKAEDKKPVLTNPGVGYGPDKSKADTKVDLGRPSIIQVGKRINAGQSPKQAVKSKSMKDMPSLGGIKVSPEYAKQVADKQKKEKAAIEAQGKEILRGLTAPGREVKNKAAVNKILTEYVTGPKAAGGIEELAARVPGLEQSSLISLYKGVPSLLTAARKARTGNITPDELGVMGLNLARHNAYENSGFWHQLMAWLKEKWAALSGGDPASTERGQAMAARNNYAKAFDVLRQWTSK